MYMEGVTNRDVYNEWSALCVLRQQEYREQELPEITKYFEKYIKGREWKDIDQDRLEFYSDWHKDVFGFRPRQTTEIGIR